MNLFLIIPESPLLPVNSSVKYNQLVMKVKACSGDTGEIHIQCGINVVVVLVTQLCLTLFDPMDCSPPGSSVHGISQARIERILVLILLI